MRRPLRVTPAWRNLLALVLVCAQFFAAAHAVEHVAELLAAQGSPSAASAPRVADKRDSVPQAERHEACLTCLAAAAFATGLPSTPALPGLLEATAQAPLCVAAEGVRWSRFPFPPVRGPPASF